MFGRVSRLFAVGVLVLVAVSSVMFVSRVSEAVATKCTVISACHLRGAPHITSQDLGRVEIATGFTRTGFNEDHSWAYGHSWQLGRNGWVPRSHLDR